MINMIFVENGGIQVATNSNRPVSLETRRAERRRREKRRKKRIRALLLFIFLIAAVILIVIAFASCSGKNNENNNAAGNNIENTALPEGSVPPAATPDTLGSLPSPELENDLLKVIEAADAQSNEKVCYLTFDDGPSENVTPAVLDVLRRYNVKATFFTLGAAINSNPDIARRLFEEGHLIANHSNGHNYETLYATAESFMGELQMAEEAILSATGGDHKFKLFRFPGGSYNAGDHAAEKQEYKEVLRANGIFYIDWNTLTGDAEGKAKNAQELLEYLQYYTDTDSSAVVLMHDAAAKTATAEALPLVIEWLMSEGYTFKRLDEMPAAAAPQTPQGAYGTDSGYGTADGTDGTNSYGTTGGTDSYGTGSTGSSGNGYGTGYSSSTYGGTSDSSGGSIINAPSSGTTTRTSVNGSSVTE